MRASPADGAFRRHAVAPGDGFDGRRELGLGQTAHLRDQRRQGFQLFPEGLDGMIGHRVRLSICVRTLN